MNSVGFFLTAVAALLGGVLFVQLRSKRRRKLPPQPKGDLIAGYAFKVSSKRYLDHANLAREFGDIHCFRIFHKHIFMLNSYEIIKEAFVDNGDWLSGRSGASFQKEFTGGLGLISSQGDLWKEHRRFSLAALKDFGLGKSRAERIIQDELEYLRSEIDAHEGRAFDPKQAFVKAVSNVICAIVFSERSSEDAKFEEMINKITEMVTKGPRSPAYYIFWPVVKHIPGDFSGLKSLLQIRQQVYDYVEAKYRKHVDTFDPNNIRDFIDAFLDEMRKPGSEARWFNEKQLIQSIWDLFLAGAETTSTTLLWALTLLASYPDVQRQAQAEIDRVIGDSKLPESADRLKLRFVDAVVCEVQRFATITPFAVPHAATQSRQLRGYDIEKGSVLFTNVWNVHRNAPCWVDPYSFNPQNFLDADGNVINTTYLIPFGVGKRSCLGEALARQELFVFLTGLLQRYDIKPDPTSKLPGIEDCDCTGIIRSPQPYHIVMTPRSSKD